MNMGKVVKIAVVELVVVGLVFFFIGFGSGRDYERAHPKEIKTEVVK